MFADQVFDAGRAVRLGRQIDDLHVSESRDQAGFDGASWAEQVGGAGLTLPLRILRGARVNSSIFPKRKIWNYQQQTKLRDCMINHVVTGVVPGNEIKFCSLLASHSPSAVGPSDTKSHQHSSEGWAMTAATAFLIQQGAAQVTRPVCRCCANPKICCAAPISPHTRATRPSSTDALLIWDGVSPKSSAVEQLRA